VQTLFAVTGNLVDSRKGNNGWLLLRYVEQTQAHVDLLTSEKILRANDYREIKLAQGSGATGEMQVRTGRLCKEDFQGRE